ncbi:alpha-2-macroglobulin family protein [Parasulfitobacter algicola]|uniref:Alpha-2-macroglobulin family protein n=1 Tax=Parasulfitobacter algicola TaxID=2614809 RepID=A0ABX2ISL0_9RHOB|nr:alpha-2-macroglobulin family protein [Sulfitobacter algicola]NSX53203.1 alpha-2-macroglobulin family protein [Sulfitobacter algicola]
MRLGTLVLAFITALPVYAQDVIPDKYITVTKDVDFIGTDIGQFFDTNAQACREICVQNESCVAFTFNARSNACFPKSSVTAIEPFQGALSARVFPVQDRVIDRSMSLIHDLDFLRPADLKGARELAETIALSYDAGDKTLVDLLAEQNVYNRNGNKVWAVRAVGAAVTLTDRSDLWTDYSELALDVRSGNHSFVRTAIHAAVNGYLRAEDNIQRHDALRALAAAASRANQGRDAIESLQLAQEILPNAETEQALSLALDKFGLRVTKHDVFSERATPRVCTTFSEKLAQSDVDFTTFVKMGDADLSIDVQGEQLCIEGIEHGATQQVTFRTGLPADSGLVLERDVTLDFYVGDRKPALSFPGRGYVLPKTADAALPIETVNIEQIELSLHQVSDRSLLDARRSGFFTSEAYGWGLQRFEDNMGPVVWTGTGEVSLEMNRDMTTRLPMAEALQGLTAGVYVLQARVPGENAYDTPAALQWFVVSDLGLSSMLGSDGLHVFVRGLGDAQAKPGTKITLLSNANAVLGEVMTDDKGYAVFDAAMTRGTGGMSPAMLTAELGDDLSFISLKDPAFDLSDRGVEGNPPAPPIDVFLTTDRGAYRAGETVYATVLARDPQVKALTDMPLTAILTRADGVEYTRKTSLESVAGGHVFEFQLGTTVPRGSWRLDIKADPEAASLTQQTFLVEDFVPERIDFDVAITNDVLRPGETASIEIDASYLFGAVAADLPIGGELRLRPMRTLSDFPGYQFGRHDARVDLSGASIPSDQKTDAQGKASIRATVPRSNRDDRPFRLEANIRIAEGGRPVERSVTKELAPTGPMIGIKPLFQEGVVKEGTQASFEIIAVNRDLQRQPIQLTWTLNRVRTRYQWYYVNGRRNWEPITRRTPIESGTITTGETPVVIETSVDWGQYEIVVESADDENYVSSSTDFYAGWYVPADTSKTPDMLEVSLDQPNYAIGETATLRMVPRMAGTALVTVVSNRLITMETIQVTEGENTLQLPVTEEWGAGAYVTATVVRPMDVEAKQNPSRALGLTYATIDPGDKALQVALEIPQNARPRGPVTIGLDVDGVARGETAYATVAAIDVGILNMTQFQSPDPSEHYFGQRRLGMEMRDIYGRLIDGLNGAQGTIRSGGDGGSAMDRASPPSNEDLVTFFSGPVTIANDGTAQVTFDVPEFNGTLRVMAVVWSDSGVGQADAELLVRDPVVVAATLPRFLSPGDQSRMLLEITHTEGPAGAMPLQIGASGVSIDLSGIPTEVVLAEKEKTVLRVPITATDIGVHSLSVALTLPDGQVLNKNLTLGVQLNDPVIARTSTFNLAAGDTFTFDDNVFAGLHPGTGSASLAIGPIARFDTPGLLNMLDRYPYGCTEQTTSKALPLLYLSEVAEAMGLAHKSQVRERVDGAIERVLSRQSSNGGFGLWRVGSGDLWLDAYVTDFLSRAKAQGFDVPEKSFKIAVLNLKNRVNYGSEFDSGGGQALAYAMLVLAREGQAKMADLRYFVDIKGNDFGTPLAAAQIGAALAMYGDPERADRMFARASSMMKTRWTRDEEYGWRLDYGTRLRDAAGVLALATEAGSTAIDRDVLVSRVSQRTGRMSTQEATWSLLAARSLVRDGSAPDFLIDGAPIDGPMVQLLQDTADAQPILISNESDREEIITMTTYGVPSEPEPAGGNGYAIERTYYSMEGTRLSPDQVKVGDRFVVVLAIDPFNRSEARLIIDDPLPAGFEIDNPNLLRGGQIAALDWLKPVNARHSEFRSDRFIAAVDWRDSKNFQLAYIVRAVSPGTFHHPAAIVEDMYRPQRRARTDTGRVVISE